MRSTDTTATPQEPPKAAQDRIRLGFIGLGIKGNDTLAAFARQPDVTIAALCDVDHDRLQAAAKGLATLRPADTPAGLHEDFRELLRRPDIDAVVNSTPDHWHALVAMHAFAAGKDVYGEKPVAQTYAEARAMQDACRRHGRVFQLGTQIHAQENYHRVVEIVRSGVLGDIREVNLWREPGSPEIPEVPDGAPPAGLNWDLWLGPAPWRPYNPNRVHRLFRHFWDYSGGTFADFWCHIADLAFWALDLHAAPQRVRAHGARPPAGMAETAGWLDAVIDFPGLRLTWTSRTPAFPGAAGRAIGARFVGSRGALVADYTSRTILLDGQERDDLPEVPRTLPRSPGHHRNFLDCIRTRQLPDSHLDYVVPMITPMFLACISYRLGRPLVWDADNERVVDDPEATAMLGRAFRPPWSLPT